MTSHEQRLQERFGLSSFHAWQREAIDALLNGPKRVLVVAPTGGGKSLCYQYPATELSGTTLVISPLIALMEDQVRSLTAHGVRATFLSSTLDFEELKAREAAVARGEFNLVYVAPERLNNRYTLEMMRALNPPLIAIDEAHCISQWGHDFRPEYLRLGDLLHTLNPPRVLACTATATPAVREEILLRLALPATDTAVVLRGFARPNLHLSCEEIDGLKGRREAAVAIVLDVLGSASEPQGGAIVYAATRKNAESMGDALVAAGFRAGVYHAGMSPEDRASVNARFASGDLNVVAATNAFGMGIDRSDIRVVVHLQAPGSIEAYYQEVGRAGRDGAPAEGVLMASASDMGLRKRLIDTRGAGGDFSARQWGMFLDLMRYVEAGSCRHDFILRYFGDDRETLGGCGHCDVCGAPQGREGGIEVRAHGDDAGRQIVRQALSGIARARGQVGMRSVAEMLAGKSSAKNKRWGFESLSTFGLLREEGVEWTVALLRRMVTAALADITSDEYPLLILTPRGVSVMKGELPADVSLPGAHAGRRSLRARGGVRDRVAPAGKTGNAVDIDTLDDGSRRLFVALREERLALARERGVPPYVVCHDRTLLGLAVHRPTTDGGLSGVHGMGPARIEAYGARLIAVIERNAGLS